MSHLKELAALREKLIERKKESEALQVGTSQSIEIESPKRLEIDEKTRSEDPCSLGATSKKAEETEAKVPIFVHTPPLKESMQPKDTLKVRPPRTKKPRVIEPLKLQEKQIEPSVTLKLDPKKDTQVRMSKSAAEKHNNRRQTALTDAQLYKPAVVEASPFQTLESKPFDPPEEAFKVYKPAQPVQETTTVVVSQKESIPEVKEKQPKLELRQAQSVEVQQQQLVLTVEEHIIAVPTEQKVEPLAKQSSPDNDKPPQPEIKNEAKSQVEPQLGAEKELQIDDVVEAPQQVAHSETIIEAEAQPNESLSDVDRKRKRTLESVHSQDNNPEVTNGRPVFKKDRITQKIYFKEAEKLRQAERNLEYALNIFEKVAELKRQNKLPPVIQEKLRMLRDIIHL